MSKQQFITGWMFLDGKVVFVKCTKTSIGLKVSSPRKYNLAIRSDRCLFKTEADCLRKNISYIKSSLDRQMENLFNIMRGIDQTNHQLAVLKDQLEKANSNGR